MKEEKKIQYNYVRNQFDQYHSQNICNENIKMDIICDFMHVAYQDG